MFSYCRECHTSNTSQVDEKNRQMQMETPFLVFNATLGRVQTGGTGEPGRDTQRRQVGKHPTRGDLGFHR